MLLTYNIIGQHKSSACVCMIYTTTNLHLASVHHIQKFLNNLHSLHHTSSVAQKKPKLVGCNFGSR